MILMKVGSPCKTKFDNPFLLHEYDKTTHLLVTFNFPFLFLLLIDTCQRSRKEVTKTKSPKLHINGRKENRKMVHATPIASIAASHRM